MLLFFLVNHIYLCDRTLSILAGRVLGRQILQDAETALNLGC